MPQKRGSQTYHVLSQVTDCGPASAGWVEVCGVVINCAVAVSDLQKHGHRSAHGGHWFMHQFGPLILVSLQLLLIEFLGLTHLVVKSNGEPMKRPN